MSTLEQSFNVARQRVLSGQQLTIAEQRELIAQLRANRFSAAETSSTSKAKKSAGIKTPKSGMSDDELAASLGDLGL